MPNTTPCAFCGHPDHEHRVRDAILSRRRAGESIESLARDYGMLPAEIEDQLRRARQER